MVFEPDGEHSTKGVLSCLARENFVYVMWMWVKMLARNSLDFQRQGSARV